MGERNCICEGRGENKNKQWEVVVEDSLNVRGKKGSYHYM